MPIYMKFDGITTGEDALEVLSFTVGCGQPGIARGLSSPSLSEIVVTKPVDTSSPKLLAACGQGQPAGRASIYGTTVDQNYFKVDLANVTVSSYQTSVSEDERPTETISFNYQKVILTYTPQSSD